MWTRWSLPEWSTSVDFSLMIRSSFTCDFQNSVKVTDSDKHSSLQRHIINSESKKFYNPLPMEEDYIRRIVYLWKSSCCVTVGDNKTYLSLWVTIKHTFCNFWKPTMRLIDINMLITFVKISGSSCYHDSYFAS